MNNSKKLQTKKVKKDRLTDKKPLPRISLPWMIVSVVLVVVLIGALLFDQLYKPAILKIDGKNYTMRDLSYYFYSVESRYQSYDSMFGGNGAYWNMVYDQATGETVREAAKDEAMQAALYNEVLYKQAISEGYTLTEEEKSNATASVENMLSSQITAVQATKNNFTKAFLNNVVSKAILVNRYTQDKIATLNIDKEAIKAGISAVNYREYDIQYLFVPTKTTDASGNSVDVTADEKKAAYDKINSVFEAAKTTEDWSTLVPADETQLTYKSTNFIESSTTYSADFKNMMTGMANGAISDIYEDPGTGYYIVRMVNNNSTASYDTAVQDAITKAEDEGFSKIYTDEILPKHTYTIYDKPLQKYTMGTITL